uniref:ANK_REP_REGION domain-containing protein n=1 Tax=Macrostomum lignano TaxID=282301 RepID=A0A1I8F9K9_9PLAT
AQSHQAGTLGRPKLDCQLLFRSASGSSIGHSLAAFVLKPSSRCHWLARRGKLGKELLCGNCQFGYTPMHAAYKTEAANFRLQWSMAALATTASSAFSDDASRDPRSSLRSSGPPGRVGSAAAGSDSRAAARTTARDWAWRFRFAD